MTKEQINEFTQRLVQSNRTQVVVITFEIIINYLDSAMDSIDNSTDDFVFNLKKARQFVGQLSSALDYRYDISKELMSLYMYASDCLLKSELRRKNVHIPEIREMMDKLKYAFEQVSSQDTSGAVMHNGEKVYEGLTYGRDAKGTVMVSK